MIGAGLAATALAAALTLAPATAWPEEPAVARARYRLGNERHSAGTVFFIQSERSGWVAVGAAHSYDFGEVGQAGWVEFYLGRTRTRVGVASRLVARPGLPFSEPGGTIRDDVVIFVLDAPPSGVRALRPGGLPERGQRVRLLGIPANIPRDEDDLFGTVRVASEDRLEVELDVPYDLRGWGGAPVVSYPEDQVLGLLQAAQQQDSRLRVIAAPIAAVREALAAPLGEGRGIAIADYAALAGERPASATRTVPPVPPPSEDRPDTLVRKAALLEKRDPLYVEIEHPYDGAVIGDAMGAFLAGQALAPVGEYRPLDVFFVLDVSQSTSDPSGADINGNGVVAEGGGGLGGLFGLGTSDAGDSILAAEVAAARHFLERLDPRSTRVGIATFSGETYAMGGMRRARDVAETVVPLTTDYEIVQSGLDRIIERGPHGMTHMAAGADQALIELLGWRGAISTPISKSEKHVIFLTDGRPTLPHEGNEAANTRAVLRAASRAARTGVHFHTFGIGEHALSGPVAIVSLAEETGGTFTPVRDPANLIDVIDEIQFAEIEELVVTNVTADAPAHELLSTADGLWSALVPLVPGRNEIVVKARTSDGREAEDRISLQYAPDAPSPKVPSSLITSQNRLLEKRLLNLKRSSLALEREQAEDARRTLELQIERERVEVEVEKQRKELELDVQETPAP